jgi:ABC-2 type transport system ATP-binding protein
MIILDGLSVHYGRTEALKNVRCEIPGGAVGLLGPNGAGKTTLLKTLIGFLDPAGGRASVLGRDIKKNMLTIRQKIGYMPEDECYFPGMNAVSFTAYAGELAGMPPTDAMQRAHEVLFYVGLGEARYRNVDTYSRGMKQRIKLAQALVHDPELLFLDEPTNGMDPKGRQEMLDLIRDISNKKDISLILSSHLLPDVEYVCENVVVLSLGEIVKTGRIADLMQAGKQIFELKIKGDMDAFTAALDKKSMTWTILRGGWIKVDVPLEFPTRTFFEIARDLKIQIRNLKSSVQTLEDVFLEAVGEKNADS